MTPSHIGTALDAWPQAALDLLPTPVFLSAVPEGTIVRCNQRAVELCGRTPYAERLWQFLHCAAAVGGAEPTGSDRIETAIQTGSRLRDIEGVLEAAGGPIAASVSVEPVLVDDRVVAALTACHTIARWKDASRVEATFRTEAALRESEERFHTLADNIAQLAWMADETGSIFWYNRRWFEYTGKTLDEMKGWGWQDVHHPDHVHTVVEKIRRCFQTGEPWEDTFPLRARDGTFRWFLSRALPIRNQHGQITRWLGTNTDVTDLRRAEEALLEADRRKDEFLAVLAHELRGPLAPIMTAVRLLQMKGPVDPELEKPRETIIRQTMQLSKLVDDLLDVGRITSGKLRLDKTRVELSTILKQAAETCGPSIELRRHTLNIVFPDSSIDLDVDAGRIVQVVCNLLNNAAKYMEEGGRIELAASSEDGIAVIRVRDEGAGIPPDMLGRIFQRFVQVGSSADRADGGLGVGLSLVKSVVELHGGSVDARSDGIGKGSEFIVRLPALSPKRC